MKLLSRNIAIREANTDGVINFLHQIDADIVCLQEVGKAEENGVKGEYDSFHAIQKTKLYSHWFISESHEFKAFNTRNIDFGGYMRQGILLLSKYPILQAETRFYHRSFERREDFSTRKETDHGRMMTRAIININGNHVQVCNIHGIRTADKKGDERTNKQCEFIINKTQECSLPTIIAGDLNLLPDTEGIHIMNKFFQNNISKFNITSSKPERTGKVADIIDYVFTKNIEAKNCYTINNDVSDHLPLIAEF